MKALLKIGPSVILLLGLVLASVTMFQGTMASVVAWHVLMVFLPTAGIFWVLCVLVSAAIRRSWGHWRTAGSIAGLLCALPGLWILDIGRFPFPLEDDAGLELLVRVPMEGEVIVFWGGDTIEENYHSFSPDQRWAYDLVMDPALTGSTDLEDYGCFGQPVHAPVDGRVHRVVSDRPDQQPTGALVPDLENPAGNSVWIQPAQGGFLLLAHLKQGSVNVEVGQTVKAGEIVGACGNSGNTSEPHLHMHYQTHDPNEYPISLAVGRPLGFHHHGGPTRPKGGVAVEGDQVRLVGDRIRHRAEE